MPPFYGTHAAKATLDLEHLLATNELPSLPNVAFRTPGERKVLIVLNDDRSAQTFSIRDGDHLLTSTLPAGAVGTYVWP
jgi:glucosylceramidase